MESEPEAEEETNDKNEDPSDHNDTEVKQSNRIQVVTASEKLNAACYGMVT